LFNHFAALIAPSKHKEKGIMKIIQKPDKNLGIKKENIKRGI